MIKLPKTLRKNEWTKFFPIRLKETQASLAIEINLSSYNDHSLEFIRICKPIPIQQSANRKNPQIVHPWN